MTHEKSNSIEHENGHDHTVSNIGLMSSTMPPVFVPIFLVADRGVEALSSKGTARRNGFLTKLKSGPYHPFCKQNAIVKHEEFFFKCQGRTY